MRRKIEPIIIVDTREQRPWVFSRSAVVARGTVPSGADYSILGYEDRIGIERKSLADLVGSLTQGRKRFARSLRRLAQRTWRAVIVEAPLSQLLWGGYRSQATPDSMLGSVCSIIADGIPVLFADDPGAAAQLAERQLRKFHARAQQADAIGCVDWLDEEPKWAPVAFFGPKKPKAEAAVLSPEIEQALQEWKARRAAA